MRATNLKNISKIDGFMYYINNLEINIFDLKIYNVGNFYVTAFCDMLIYILKFIKLSLVKKLQSPWDELQDEMDRLSKEDNTLTGFTIDIDRKESNKPNRGYIHYKLF